MSSTDVTDAVELHVHTIREWLAEQPHIRRVTIESKQGLELRVGRKKVHGRGDGDKGWQDISADFPVRLPSDQSIEEEGC